MFGHERETRVDIDGRKFTINGEYTYAGQSYDGHSIEGLLFNSRMVQALFDDDNPDTVDRWAYPDTGEWDPERNVREFVEMLPTWREKGLRAVTINLQGGSPEGYSEEQPWIVSAFEPDGTLKEEWFDRLEHILDAADEAGVVVILGYFYFGADDLLEDEESVVRAVENATDWLLEREYTNVLVEINNECDIHYDHEILKPDHVVELIELVRERETNGFSYPVSASFSGDSVTTDAIVDAADFVLLHGNTVDDPDRIAEMVQTVRERPSYEPKPIVFNEDDHFGFDEEPNNMYAALASYASWGYFDPGESNYRDGYQCPPVNWELSTERKRQFFDYLDRITSE